ncbi:hypothetical protein C8R43DRAFT_1126508 [Mycena crocata]|nr:hypothetical protein C8R43DRAFT_1126508 [Mycena crocata]
MERSYVESDLTGTRNDLIKLVQRQQTKWNGKFNKSRVTVAQLKSALLDSNYGFTTNNPPPVVPEMVQTVTGTAPVMPAAAPVPISASSVHDVEAVELLDVRVYVEDLRFVPASKTVAIIPMRVLDRNHCSVDAFRVLSKEIIFKLQRSNSAIGIQTAGMVRVSVPDPEEPDWKIPFVLMAYGQSVESMEFNPEALEVHENPTGSRLKLFIENMNSISTAPHAMKTGEDRTPALASTSSFDALPETDTKKELNQPGVKYLLEKLAVRAGYDSFAAQRGRVLSNPEAVKGWRFAVNFTRDYNKVRTPQPNSVKITKDMIQKSLGIASTWLSNAHTAIRIIDMYSRDKQHATTEVIEVLERVDDQPEGSSALYTFLTEWDKNHPIDA